MWVLRFITVCMLVFANAFGTELIRRLGLNPSTEARVIVWAVNCVLAFMIINRSRQAGTQS